MNISRFLSPSVCSLFVFLPALVLASPLPFGPQNDLNLSPRDAVHPLWGCSFGGNSDLYGLGIRLGVYLQLLSTMLANTCLPPSIRKDAKNTNAIIMISVFIGEATATRNGQMNSVEIFIMSMILSAFLFSDFTPAHISALVLCRDEVQEQGSKDDEEQSSDQDARYFAAIARSIFGTAIALFNTWYWLYGRHAFLKNKIADQKCEPTIFLETQIVLSGYQPMFYIIISVAHSIYEVVFMIWWVAILGPGTLKLLFDVVKITILAIFTFKISKFREIRKKFSMWYFGFARLDPRTLRIFERMRLSDETYRKLRGLKYTIQWFGMPAGWSVIIWCSIAIELTLAWNTVSGVYVLASTGQLIPFMVGLLGLLRILHLIAVQYSETPNKNAERIIRVDWSEGRFVYGSGRENQLSLVASRPDRRWSIDLSNQNYLVGGMERYSGQRVCQSQRGLIWNSEK